MKTKYGAFTDASVDDYKIKLHKKIFWLLLYKDPATADEYTHVDFERYFTGVMKQLNGLESMVLSDGGQLIELMSLLQAAYDETLQPQFNYRAYRKLVLDAEAAIDRLELSDDQPQ